MARTGRPRKAFDADQFEKLCAMQCTEEECAGFFDMSVTTLRERIRAEYDMTFSEVYARASAGGKISVRQKQYKRAMEGSDQMLIHLGKHWLGQHERQEHTGARGGPIETLARTIEQMTPEERKQRIDELERKRTPDNRVSDPGNPESAGDPPDANG